MFPSHLYIVGLNIGYIGIIPRLFTIYQKEDCTLQYKAMLTWFEFAGVVSINS